MEREFKDILKKFLKKNFLTQTKFALAVGVKQSQVSERFKGLLAVRIVRINFAIAAYSISEYSIGLIAF